MCVGPFGLHEAFLRIPFFPFLLKGANPVKNTEGWSSSCHIPVCVLLQPKIKESESMSFTFSSSERQSNSSQVTSSAEQLGWPGQQFPTPSAGYSCSPQGSVSIDLGFDRWWGGRVGAWISAFWREILTCFSFLASLGEQTNVCMASKRSRSIRLLSTRGR